MTDRWQEAFDAHQKAAHEHPLYPVLFRKVARAEAEWSGPRRIESRYRAGRRDIAIYWDGSAVPTFHTPRWRQTLIVHDGYGPREPVSDAWKFAEQMIADVFPDPWPARGDMTAAIYGAAREDVRARRDLRRVA